MNLIKRILYVLLILFILLVAFVSFMLNSTTGLYTTLYVAKKTLPGTLHYKNVKGRLLGPIKIQELSYEDPQQRIEIKQLHLQWKPRALWHKEIRIKKLSAQKLILNTKTVQQEQSSDPLTWPQLPVNITLNKLSISDFYINDTPVHDLNLAAKLTNTNWQVNTFSVRSEDINLRLKGRIDPRPPHQANFYLTAASQPKSLIPIKGHLSFKGNTKLFQWDAELDEPLSASMQGSLDDLQQIKSTVDWKSFKYPLTKKQPFHLQNGTIKVHGEYPNLDFSASAEQVSPIPATISLHGQTNLKTMQFQGSLQSEDGHINFLCDAGFEGNRFIKTSLSAKNVNLEPVDIPFFIDSLRAEYHHSDTEPTQGTLVMKGHQKSTPVTAEANLKGSQLTAHIQQQKNTIHLRGKIPFPLTVDLDIPEPSSLNPALQGLTTHIKGNINLLKENQANAHLQIAKGQWQNPDDASIPPLLFQGGEFQAKLDRQKLRVLGNLTIDPHKTLRLSLQMPNYSLYSPNKPDQRVEGQLKLDINNLKFLEGISTEITEANGTLQTSLQVNGTLAKPNTQGSIQLKNGAFVLSTMGINLKPVQLGLNTQNGQWLLDGTIGSHDTAMRLQGSGTFSPKASGTITLSGQNVLLVNSNEYVIYLSPDIKVQLADNTINITGNIQVPKAELKPQTFGGSETLSDDVVFVSEKRSEEKPSQIKTDISVTMGEDVQLNVQGLTARIIGGIRLQNRSSGPFNASGQLSVVDGKYAAYGQKLTISQGELLFSGGQIDNPGINVRAVRTFSSSSTAFSSSNRLLDFGSTNIQSISFANQLTVGIQISGRLKTPKVTLFSEPANLPQADILSMLLLGRPASQASGSGGQLLLSAISTMDLGQGSKGTQLLSQLQSALGLDFDLQNTSTYDQQTNTVSENRSLAVSKSFSERLSISYNAGLSNLDSTGLTLKYLLNRFFSVQVTASTDGSGVDFIYTHTQE